MFEELTKLGLPLSKEAFIQAYILTRAAHPLVRGTTNVGVNVTGIVGDGSRAWDELQKVLP